MVNGRAIEILMDIQSDWEEVWSKNRLEQRLVAQFR